MTFVIAGCATKKHVRESISPVESRVGEAEKRASDLEKKSAENASAISQLEAGVSKADERAMEADRKAAAAGQSATQANEAAKQAAQRAEDARLAAEKNMARLDQVVQNLGNYQVMGSESVLFRLNSATLSDEAKQKLDEFSKTFANNPNIVIEVQGFTDKTGSMEHNLELSRRRANAVVRYLTVNHNVPLRRVHVLGVGSDVPVADNKTREGRKENRRVEVKVYNLNLSATGSDQRDQPVKTSSLQ
jgi:outer membrane protein OmpA-like peptidoglycan-associated protein